MANATGRLAGKVAVVTGAGRNIGRAEAMLLAAQGASVVVNDFGGGPYGTEPGNPTLAETVVAEIRAAGGQAVAEGSNVASMRGGAAIVQKAIDSFGRIDILVNNAGIVRPGRVDKLTEHDWDLCVGVSLKASFASIKAAAPHFIAQQSGVIVNTGSPSGFGHWGMSAYSAAKEGLMGLTRTVARELGEFGVRCNLIRPVSHVTTTFTEEVGTTIAEAARLNIPLLWNRFMTTPRMTALPDHVAALVVWLCTDRANHVSGRDFFIQGDEVALLPEPEAIRSSYHPGGWTLDAFDEPATQDYLFGSVQNRFVKTG